MKKIPIWELLLREGFFCDRKEAESWIMMGKVLANNQRIDNPGEKVTQNTGIIIKGFNQKYVSKGGLKLEGALRQFNMNIEGMAIIDAGASTGGFTDCLLQHGAAKVYAVDVGFGQLAGKLRIDSRVVNMERMNISDVSPDDLEPRPILATIDLSYLSLREAIPVFARILNGKGEMLCLVKPLFEVQDSELRRKGEITDNSIYISILKGLAAYIDNLGFMTTGVTYSPVTGNKGTKEFFIRISLDIVKLTNAVSLQDIDKQIDTAVKAVEEITTYKKER